MSRRKKRSPSIAKQAAAAFQFLTGELGFKLTRAEDEPRESYAAFESAAVTVTIVLEPPDSVSVQVAQKATNQSGAARECHGLLFLVRDSSPELEPRLRELGQSIDDKLRTQAELLQRCGTDVLAGDFSRSPRLRRLRADETRRYNKETFGTSTGETPRFASRPALEALFADAQNQGMSVARVYQAYWDYAYSLDEIARFLGMDGPAIQAMLDKWDGL
jgi:hypothetical protein